MSLVFTTVPGVQYEVEYSQDLRSWATDYEVYGLGFDFVVPMVEISPPPPESPPAGPVPSQTVSLILEESSGVGGGVVISWPSLDSGEPVEYLAASETLDSAWSSVPLHAQVFGDYMFFFMHFMQPESPPATNPTLGPLDSAMITELLDNFSTLNSTIANMGAQSQNTPQTSPTAADHGFWRVKLDYSIDSDSDTIPDYVEFAIAADGSHPNNAIADALVSDADGNGIPDNRDFNEDQDATLDYKDASPDDEVIDWERPPQPRYAVFDASNTLPDPIVLPWTDGSIVPLQMNDLGHVLYLRHIWADGQIQDLDLDGPLIEQCIALGMNNKGEIIGIGFSLEGGGSSGGGGGGGTGTVTPQALVLAYWADKDAEPIPVNKPDPNDPNSEIFAGPAWNQELPDLDGSHPLAHSATSHP